MTQPTRSRRTHRLAALAAALLLGPGVAMAGSSPGDALAAWESALAADDHAAYVACLHSGAREAPAYASAEAMAFWAGQMAELRARGFDGRFAFETATGDDPRTPAGAVLAYPIVNGEPLREAIVLLHEGGRWTILRPFS